MDPAVPPAAPLVRASSHRDSAPVNGHRGRLPPALAHAALQTDAAIGPQPPLYDMQTLRFEWCHGRNLGSPSRYRQRKIWSATPKLATPHMVTTASGDASEARDAPSIITPRSESFSAVSGNARTNGSIASGKRA